MNKSYNKELNYFIQGISDLEEYLLSNELYWNLPGFPRLTLGGLLLSKVRLKASTLEESDKEQFDISDRKMELINLKWKVAWEKKVKREIGSRLELWKNYLADYWSATEDCKEAYIHEVRWRVMLQLLSNSIAGNVEEITMLKVLDEKLKTNFIPGVFIWPEELTGFMDEDQFWFLYGTLC